MSVDVDEMCRLCLGKSKRLNSLRDYTLYAKIIKDLTGLQVLETSYHANACRKCFKTIEIIDTFRKTCLSSDIFYESLRSTEESIQEGTEIVYDTDQLTNSVSVRRDSNASVKEEPQFLDTIYENFSDAAEPSEEYGDKRYEAILESDCNVVWTEGLTIKKEERDIPISLAAKPKPKRKRRSRRKNPCDEVGVEAVLPPLTEEDKIEQRRQRRNARRREYYIRTEKLLGKKKPAKNFKDPCAICGQIVGRYQMKAHINMHEGKKPFVCDICGTSYHSIKLLGSHKKRSHNPTFNFACDFCPRRCRTSGELISHRSYHIEPTIPCPKCDKLFRNKSTLAEHAVVHTQERPFECSDCNKRFQNKKTLKIHQRLHTGEKPYVCDLCEMGFYVKCLLKNHILKYHPEAEHLIEKNPNRKQIIRPPE